MTKKIILLAAIVILLLTVWLGTTVYFTVRAVANSSASSQTIAERAALITSVLGPPDSQADLPDIPYELPGGQAGILTFSNILDGRVLTVTCGVSSNPTALPNAEGPYELALFTTQAKRWNSADWAAGVLRNLSIYAKTSPINPGDTFSLHDHTELSPEANSLLFVRYKSITVDGKPGQILLGIAVTPQELAFAKAQGPNGTADLIQKLKDNGIFPVSYLNRPSVVDPKANLVSPLEGRINRQKIDLNTPAAVTKSSPRTNGDTKNSRTGKSTRSSKQQPQTNEEEEE
jgi:hypothetical protein